MKKILVGTHNQGKFKEISYLLPKKIKKLSPQRLSFKSPKETGKTFALNAILKAKYFSKLSKLPVISDDSGLCIRELNNKPGIFSAEKIPGLLFNSLIHKPESSEITGNFESLEKYFAFSIAFKANVLPVSFGLLKLNL